MVADAIGIAVTPGVASALVGAGVGFSHYVTHRVAGGKDRVDDRDVKAAGVTASVSAAVGTYAVLTVGGV